MTIDVAPLPPIIYVNALPLDSPLPPDARWGRVQDADPSLCEAEAMVCRERILHLGHIGAGETLAIVADNGDAYNFTYEQPSQGDDGFPWVLLSADGGRERGQFLVVEANPKGGQPIAAYHRAILRRGDGLEFAGVTYRPTEPGAAPTNIRTLYRPDPERTVSSYRWSYR